MKIVKRYSWLTLLAALVAAGVFVSASSATAIGSNLTVNTPSTTLATGAQFAIAGGLTALNNPLGGRTITISVHTTPGCTDTGAALGSVTTNAGGGYVYVTALPLTAGTVYYQASYAGEEPGPGSLSYATSSACTGTIYVQDFPSSLTLGVTPTPPVTAGQTMHLTGTLLNYLGDSLIGESVRVAPSIEPDCDSHEAFVGSAGVNSSGVYDLAVTAPATAGTYHYQAFYSGNSYNNGSTSDCLAVEVIQPPTADAGGPYSDNEGSTIVLDGSGSIAYPAGNSIVSYAWTLDTTGIDAGGCHFVDGTTSASQSPHVKCDDDSGSGSFTASLTVTDTNGLTDSDSADVQIGNLAAVVGTPSATHVGACGVNVSAPFADAGISDTHVASIDWGDATSSAGSVTEAGGAGTTTGSRTYGADGVYTVTVTVTDDDGDVGHKSVSFNEMPRPSDALAPLVAGKTFKVGQTIQIKFAVISCSGNGFSFAPTVTGVTDGTTTKTAVSAAKKFQGVMQFSPATMTYVYYLSTKNLATGTWTITVSVPNWGAWAASFTLTKY